MTNLTPDEAALLAAAGRRAVGLQRPPERERGARPPQPRAPGHGQQGYLSPGQAAAAKRRRCRRPPTSGPRPSRARTGATATSSTGSRTSCSTRVRRPERIFTGRLPHPYDAERRPPKRGPGHHRTRPAPGPRRPRRRRSSRSTTRPARSRAMVGGYNYYKNPTTSRPRASASRAPRSRSSTSRWRSRTATGPNSSPLGSLRLPRAAVRHLRRAQRRGRLRQREDPPLRGAGGLRQQRVLTRRASGRGTRNIAALANQFGITTTVSYNPSMVIGGLHIGVTPLDMAHAYETIAQDGDLVSGVARLHPAPAAARRRTSGRRPRRSAPSTAAPARSGSRASSSRRQGRRQQQAAAYAVYPDRA